MRMEQNSRGSYNADFEQFSNFLRPKYGTREACPCNSNGNNGSVGGVNNGNGCGGCNHSGNNNSNNGHNNGCGNNCNNNRNDMGNVGGSNCNHHNNNNVHNTNTCPLAMVYAVKQEWQNIYDPEIALLNGTVFEELNMPFYKSGCSINGGCRGNSGNTRNGGCR